MIVSLSFPRHKRIERNKSGFISEDPNLLCLNYFYFENMSLHFLSTLFYSHQA